MIKTDFKGISWPVTMAFDEGRDIRHIDYGHVAADALKCFCEGLVVNISFSGTTSIMPGDPEYRSSGMVVTIDSDQEVFPDCFSAALPLDLMIEAEIEAAAATYNDPEEGAVAERESAVAALRELADRLEKGLHLK